MARAAPKAPRKGATVRLNRRQRLAWLRLIRSENVGPATFRALVNEFGGAEAAIDAVPMLSRRGGRTHDIRLYREDEAEGRALLRRLSVRSWSPSASRATRRRLAKSTLPRRSFT